MRVATYNIKFLDADISSTRDTNLKDVIRELDVDVIGLQKIKDRAVPRQISPRINFRDFSRRRYGGWLIFDLNWVGCAGVTS
jgi:endonuclease/exonuclease/phosphatase family metal-dependent hydrolase